MNISERGVLYEAGRNISFVSFWHAFRYLYKHYLQRSTFSGASWLATENVGGQTQPSRHRPLYAVSFIYTAVYSFHIKFVAYVFSGEWKESVMSTLCLQDSGSSGCVVRCTGLASLPSQPNLILLIELWITECSTGFPTMNDAHGNFADSLALWLVPTTHSLSFRDITPQCDF